MNAEELFWDIAEELQSEDTRIVEGKIMSSRCLRVDDEFLAMANARKDWGLVVKLPRERVDELVQAGSGQPFAPAGKVFKEWISVPEPNRERWRALLLEGVDFVAPREA